MKREKILSLQALRAFGFIMIFLNHTPDLLPFKIPDLGARGVELFFALSGFTIAYNHYGEKKSYSLKTSINYCINKAKKFYLLHLITFIAAALLVIVQDVFKTGYTFIGVIKLGGTAIINLLLLQSWIPSRSVYYSFNGVSWFLSTLIFCYFMTPIILHIIEMLRKPRNWYILAVLIILFKIVFETIWIRYIGWNNAYVFHISPFYKLLEYTIGCLLGTIFLYKRNVRSNQNVIITSIMQVASLSLYIVAVVAGNSSLYRAYYVVLIMFLIYNLAFEDGIISKVITNKVTLHVSKISLELFILHQVVIRYVEPIYSRIINKSSLSKGIEWCLILILSIFISEIVYLILFKSKKKDIILNATQ